MQLSVQIDTMRSKLIFYFWIFLITVVFSVGTAGMEGPSVTLHTDGQEYNQILWKFGPQNWFIARCNIRDTPLCEITDETSLTHMNLSPEQAELYKRIINSFRDRLKIDNNGSLTIKNISDEHAGLYTLQIFNKSNKVDTSTFNVSVSPKIVNDSKCSECVQQCSVENVTQVTLSWIISSTAPFLEVEYQDTNGNCVVNNSVTDLTKQDCQCMSPSSDSDRSPVNIALICVPVVLVLLGVAVAVTRKICKTGRNEAEPGPSYIMQEIEPLPVEDTEV